MEREEPSTSLVDTLSNEIGREKIATVKRFLVFKRIMDLRVRHGSGVKPYVD